MRQLYFWVIFAAYSFSTNAQIVAIPDANFKNALVNTPCVTQWFGLEDGGGFLGDVDTNNDGEIQVGEAAAVEGLIISNQNISSLTGIEAFTGLWRLECDNNNLSTLTVTQSDVLIYLDCSHNQLTSLATSFYLNGDQLYDMHLDCRYNQLTTLNVPAGQRYYVYCGFNPLTQITQPAGWYNGIDLLAVENNNFTTFDPAVPYRFLTLKNCPLMTSCNVGGDTVAITENPVLTSAVVWSGAGIVDIHNNPVLQSIDMKDGVAPFSTGDIYDGDFNFTNNPALEFVCLDDMGYWYTEGSNTFFNAERDYVSVSPGVAITYYCDFAPGGGYNTITGTLHYDCNGVNTGLTPEDGEINLVNNGGTATVNPVNGDFVFYTVGSGTVTPSLGNNYFTVSPANYPYSFTGTGNTQNVNFCLTPNGIHPDMEISVIPTASAVPGFDALYKIVYTNKGTETLSGNIALAFEDDLTDFVSANPPIASQATGVLTWNFSNLAPFETREIDVTLNVNSPLETPPVNSGDILDFTASATPAMTDQTPSDNANVLAQTVVNSFDPNDKAVSRTTIPPTGLNQYLYYTVRFQNTGTFEAQNVVVRDMIDSKLDFSTLEIVAASHTCRTRFTPQTTNTPGDKAEFIFEGIDLPAEQDNEPASHGFVTYKIKPDNNLVIGNVIANTAEIYFDYNAPIVTNTVTTTVTSLGIDGYNLAGSIAVYPNPANQSVTIGTGDSALVKSVMIFNLLGQKIANFAPAFENGQMDIDLTLLDSGTYLIQIASDKGTINKKLIKL